MSNRRAVFVVGSGRSGTSAMSGTLRTLGVHVPQPEVVANRSNPKGFGEPRWVVDLHDELLGRSHVTVSDARPRAGEDAALAAQDPAVRARVAQWLGAKFAGEDGEPVDEIVVKDPRTSWFVDLWADSAHACDATASYITMLRPVTEVVGSKQKYYGKLGAHGSDRTLITRTAGWINMMLHTEATTRGQQRRFVRYVDLLSDWSAPVFALGDAFDLQALRHARPEAVEEVNRFIDPDLHRVTLTWDDVPVPSWLREIADETWAVLDAVVDPERDDTDAHRTFDQLREAYADRYAEAEALVGASIAAARRDGARKARQAAREKQQATAPQPAKPYAADRVPHAVRAMVPAGVRKSMRKVLRRER